MTRIKLLLIIFLLFIHSAIFINAQVNTNIEVLKRMARIEGEKNQQNLQLTFQKAKKFGWPLQLEDPRTHAVSVLKGIDCFGFPIYISTAGNISAATISTDKVWSKYAVSGSSNNMLQKLAIWDGGTVRKTHIELTGRILQKDSAFSIHSADDHATHTTGTMIATGINSAVKGMSYGTQKLVVYDFMNDFAEVSSEASGLLLSNHSYGTNAGWLRNGGSWFFYGNPDSLEDYKFGFYGQEAQMWDSILYNAPNYLIVQAAGNNRDQNGPSVGGSFQYFSPLDSSTVLSGTRRAGMSNNDSYNTIPTYGNAKNILTVGAVNGLTNGYTTSSNVVMSTFSSWGPTDDGRIKPDLVANGVGVLSTTASSDKAYGVISGTSMAAPSVTGSLFLLQELYSKKHNGSFLKSASLKGIAIHTADEAGTTPGPDYQFGWGLMNTKKAADFVENKFDTVIENVLNNPDTFRYSFVASGGDMVKATLVWTDAPASINYAYRLNNPTTKLINDLDVTVVSNGKTYFPWVLNPNQPQQAAFKGVNILDNVERVDIDSTIPGNLYTVIITHKGNLQRGSQAFSLIISGVNGDSACVSKPVSSAGLTIDSIAVTSLQLKNKLGCTNYTDNRKYIANIEPHQVVPFNIRLGNCGGSGGVNAVVKIFIDYNHNGSYSDPGELVATSNVLVGNNTFSSSFTTPYNLQPGTKTTMRIVAVETNDTAAVKPCGTYGNGETQDISLQIQIPSNDVAVNDIIAPVDSTCNGSNLIAVQLANNGSGVLNNIPLTLIVKNGATIISTQNAVCKSIVNAGDIFTYTFPAAVNLLSSKSYSISVTANLSSDQDSTNNSFSKTILTAAPIGTPSGIGEICLTNGYALLEVVNNVNGTNYYWYDSPLNDVPVATGTTANTNTIPANHTYYLTTGISTQGIGLSSKNLFPNGGSYNSLMGNSTYFRYSSNTNIVLQSAKLYTGYPGKITISAGDFSGSTFVSSASVSINVPATLATPVKGTYSVNDPADTGAVYILNLPLRSGAHYIVISTDSNATVFTNNNLTGNPYPMGNTNSIALLSNGASSYQNFYAGLYALKLASADCPSTRVPVVVSTSNPPVITLSHDTLYSSNNNSNQWYQDGNSIMFANDNYLVVSDSAMYTVSSTDSMGCTQTSLGVIYDPTVLSIDTSSKGIDSIYAFSLYPYPVISNTLGVKFSLKGKSDVKIFIVNALGQLCLYKEYPGFTGNFNQQLWINNLSAGIYYITVQLRSNTVKKGLICIKK